MMMYETEIFNLKLQISIEKDYLWRQTRYQNGSYVSKFPKGFQSSANNEQ